MLTDQHETWLTGCFITAFIILATAFSSGPIFEGPDEIEHYRYIRYLAQYQALPDPAGQMFGEYHQAPLYYMLLTPLAALLPDGDFARIEARTNPNYPYNFTQPGSDNKNLYLHSAAENFPYTASETARTIHILRLTSVMFGVGTLLASRVIFRLLWRDDPARRIIALALVAFLPQFVYLSSVLNNDTLGIFLATVALMLVLAQRLKGYTWSRAAVLGVALGAALLTKVNLGLLALPMAIITLTDRRSWRYAAVTLAVTLLVAGWWYLHNTMAYNDPFNLKANMITWYNEPIQGGTPVFSVGVRRALYAYETLWARFGHGAVSVSPWLYRLYDLLALMGVLGLGLRLIRREKQASLWIVVLFGFIWVLGLLYYASVAYSGNQGRYLLPGIASWAVLWAFGISAWWENRLRLNTIAVLGGSFTLAAACMICLFGYFFPAYQPLSVPADFTPTVLARYDESAELIGITPANPTGKPGETIAIDLYWRALNPTDMTTQVYVHTAFAEFVLWRDSLPGNGNLLASDWTPGLTWAERYYATIPPDAPIGHEYLLTIGLYNPATGTELPATTAEGESLGAAPVLAVIRVN